MPLEQPRKNLSATKKKQSQIYRAPDNGMEGKCTRFFFLLEPMLCFTFMFQEIKTKKSQVFAENVSTACMLC